MRVQHRALRLANFVARNTFRKKVPTYFHGEWIWLNKLCWSSLYSRYELRMAEAIKTSLPPKSVFWDCGANIGLMSLYAAKLGASVLAFEPSPKVLCLLQKNISGTAIAVMPYGIGNEDATKTFSAQGTSTASSFVEEVTAINRHHFPDEPIQHVQVTMRRLDTILDAHQPPDLVKIDIEGFELEALRGATRLLSTIRPKLLIEIHPPQLGLSGGSEADVFGILKRYAYSTVVIDRNPNSLYTIKAEPIQRQM